MGKSSKSSSKSAPKSAPKKQAPPPSKPVEQKKTAPTTQPQQQNTLPQQQTSQPGMMGNFVSSMGGAIAGNYIADKLFGDKNSDNEDNHSDNEEISSCMTSEKDFNECLKQNQNSIQQCQFFFDQLQQCKNLSKFK